MDRVQLLIRLRETDTFLIQSCKRDCRTGVDLKSELGFKSTPYVERKDTVMG